MTKYNPEAFEPFDDWYECTFDDARTIAALMGWRINDIFFSGFWSQGDGACFTGTLGYAKGCARAVKQYAPTDSTLHDIAARWQSLQARNFYQLSATVSRGYGANHYSHENTVTIETETDCENNREPAPGSVDAATDIARDFMRWIYKRLEAEYEYQCAWQHASRWSDCADEATAALEAARDAVSDYRATIRSKCAATLPDSVKRAAKLAIRGALVDWQDSLELRAEIADNFHYWQDGASVSIEQFASENL